MMTQEEYMDVSALKRQGWTIKQIAEHLEYHPATIAAWLKRGGPPPKRELAVPTIVDDRWKDRVAELLRHNIDLIGTSVFRILTEEGFTGSYPTLARHLRAVRGVRRGKVPEVSVPIETAPAEEAQADWSDCCDWGERWGLGELHCFGGILCWSRYRHWWFASSIDQSHTFEGMVRFFEDAGGVTSILRVDRMGCLGRSAGRSFRLHPPALDFARHHGIAIKACQSRDAKRKGKIERPFGELDAFLAEVDALGPPETIDELNRRAERWLGRHIHSRPHRTTGVPPIDRIDSERRLLGPLPRSRYDTARREPRRAGAPVPLVEWDGVAYSVPPEAVGSIVEVRQPVGQGIIEIRHGGVLVGTHRIAPAGAPPQWDPEHRRAAEAIALGRHQRPPRHLRVVEDGPSPTIQLDLWGDVDVAPPDLSVYDAAVAGCGCVGGRR